jgi:DNA-binding NtrC family response regulator
MEKKASILIVDDDISLCKTMTLILGRKGYVVTTAQDGLEAIERVKERPFDMTFVDIKMPLMNGVETYRRIKKIRPEAVVMMMTAYAVEDLVQKALQEGAYGITYKPLDIERVVTLIERVREVR